MLVRGQADEMLAEKRQMKREGNVGRTPTPGPNPASNVSPAGINKSQHAPEPWQPSLADIMAHINPACMHRLQLTCHQLQASWHTSKSTCMLAHHHVKIVLCNSVWDTCALHATTHVEAHVWWPRR
eukprot:1150400-Pelagomonas_calceolata.AAC.1